MSSTLYVAEKLGLSELVMLLSKILMSSSRSRSAAATSARRLKFPLSIVLRTPLPSIVGIIIIIISVNLREGEQKVRSKAG